MRKHCFPKYFLGAQTAGSKKLFCFLAAQTRKHLPRKQILLPQQMLRVRATMFPRQNVSSFAEASKEAFQVLALRQNESYEGLTLKTSAFRIPVRWLIYIINSVDKTNFFRYHSPTDAAPQLLWKVTPLFVCFKVTCDYVKFVFDF